jgi:hypothetical protein
MHDERSRKVGRQLDGDRIAILLQANVGDDLSCLITELETPVHGHRRAAEPRPATFALPQFTDTCPPHRAHCVLRRNDLLFESAGD